MKVPEFTSEEHFDQALHNETFLRYLVDGVLTKRSEFADWALVVVFYAALHFTKGKILRDHRQVARTHRDTPQVSGHISERSARSTWRCTPSPKMLGTAPITGNLMPRWPRSSDRSKL